VYQLKTCDEAQLMSATPNFEETHGVLSHLGAKGQDAEQTRIAQSLNAVFLPESQLVPNYPKGVAGLVEGISQGGIGDFGSGNALFPGNNKQLLREGHLFGSAEYSSTRSTVTGSTVSSSTPDGFSAAASYSTGSTSTGSTTTGSTSTGSSTTGSTTTGSTSTESSTTGSAYAGSTPHKHVAAAFAENDQSSGTISYISSSSSSSSSSTTTEGTSSSTSTTDAYRSTTTEGTSTSTTDAYSSTTTEGTSTTTTNGYDSTTTEGTSSSTSTTAVYDSTTTGVYTSTSTESNATPITTIWRTTAKIAKASRLKPKFPVAPGAPEAPFNVPHNTKETDYKNPDLSLINNFHNLKSRMKFLTI